MPQPDYPGSETQSILLKAQNTVRKHVLSFKRKDLIGL